MRWPRLIPFLCTLVLPTLSHAAITHLQSSANGNDCGTVTTCSLAFGSNVTAGSLRIISVRTGATGRTVVSTDTLGGAYLLISSAANATDGHATYIFASTNTNTTSGADTAWVTISGAAALTRISVSEFSGAATSGSWDKINGTSGNSTTPASGTATPTVDGELLFAASGNGSATTYSAGTDFTLASQVPAPASTRLATEYYIQPTAASHNGNFTQGASNQWSAALATFYPQTGGTWSVVQSKTTAAGSPCTISALTAVGAGHALVVSIKGGTGSVQPITSVTSTGDTWASPATSMSVADASAGFVDMWYLLSAAGGETSVTINSTVNTTNCYVTELATTQGPPLFDVAATKDQSAATGAPIAPAITLASHNDAIIQIIKSGGTVSAITQGYFGNLALSNGVAISTNNASGNPPTWTTTAGNSDALAVLALKETPISLTSQAIKGHFIINNSKFRVSGGKMTVKSY